MCGTGETCLNSSDTSDLFGGYDSYFHIIGILRQMALGQANIFLMYYANLAYVLCSFD